MLPVERHRFITEVLSQRGRVMVQEVAQPCHIHETARRDLALLERARPARLREPRRRGNSSTTGGGETYVPAEIDQGESFHSAATRRWRKTYRQTR